MKIKILHIQETIGSGGVEERRLSLAKHLDKNVFDQRFVCTYAFGNIPNEIRAHGFEVSPIGEFKSPFHWSQHKKVQKIIKDYQPDIIHGAVFEGVTIAAINGWLKKVPIIIIEETSDPQNRTWKGNLLMKLFSKMAHKVIGVSEGVTEEYLKGKLRISSQKAITINNGVAMPRKTTDEEISNAKIKYGIKSNDFVFGSVGRMLHDSHKRFSDLIRAFSLFAADKENVKLLLVGDGPEKEGYKELISKLSLTDKVIFTGYQSDVTLFYRMMDVFALVSAREAFGLVLAEAMLNKLPVIATKVGGMKYIVDEGNTGFHVEVGDIEKMSDKMNELYLDEKKRSNMGKHGFEKAILEYSEETYANKIMQLYIAETNKNK